MSIAPCQVCGGTGFVDDPEAAGVTPRTADDAPAADERRRGGEMPQMPCPVCSGSGSNTGL